MPQNPCPLKKTDILLNVSFIAAEHFELQAQLGCDHVFNWHALSQKTDWLIEAVEPEFIGSDIGEPEDAQLSTRMHTPIAKQ